MIDLTGQRFGRLTVIKFNGRDKHGISLWDCTCDCGKNKSIRSNALRSGQTKSCGCFQVEGFIQYNKTQKPSKTHGSSTTRLYHIWSNMLQRCFNPKNTDYCYYGEKGITVCSAWLEFSAFQTWALSNGYTDKLTIDRINSDENYAPDNCQWITNLENSNKARIKRYGKKAEIVSA